MKTFKFFAFLLFTTFALVSCDENLDKVEKLSEQFVVAYNEKDKAGIYELYKVAQKYDYLQSSYTLNADDISAEKNKETGLYEVVVNEERDQRLVFEVDSLGEAKLVDSYGVMKLDSDHSELALRTGLPQKLVSDIKQAEMLSEGSLYMQYLQELPQFKSNMCLFVSDQYYSWRGGVNSYTKLNFTVQNFGKLPISGSDYYLEINVNQTSTGNRVINTKTLDGMDLAVSERREFCVDVNELYKYAVKHDISYTVDIKYRGESQIQLMLKYADFTGEEYAAFAGREDEWDLKLHSGDTDYLAWTEDGDYIFTHVKPDENSEVKDTLYLHEGIRTITCPENIEWVKVGVFRADTLTFVGYLKHKNVKYPEEGESSIQFTKETVMVDEGIKVYKDAEEGSDVLKTLPKDSPIIYSVTTGEYSPYLKYYERNAQGLLQVVGYISNEELWPLMND